MFLLKATKKTEKKNLKEKEKNGEEKKVENLTMNFYEIVKKKFLKSEIK